MKRNAFLLLCWISITVIGAIAPGCKGGSIANADPREANRVIDSPSVAYLKALDKENKNAVFITTKDFPELKSFSNKVVQIEPLNQDLSIDFNKYLHKEYMGPIYILLPSYYIGIRASFILKCFPAYKGFTLKEVSDNYALYYTDKKR